jgi:hypothetical protein
MQSTTRNNDSLFSPDDRPISYVRVGMTVRDASGHDLGTVEQVEIGDPDAVTTQGNAPVHHDIVTDVVTAALGGEAEVPEPKRSQLLRYGFIRIDGQGLTDTDRFVRSDHIKEVSGNVVTLSVTREQLLSE